MHHLNKLPMMHAACWAYCLILLAACPPALIPPALIPRKMAHAADPTLLKAALSDHCCSGVKMSSGTSVTAWIEANSEHHLEKSD